LGLNKTKNSILNILWKNIDTILKIAYHAYMNISTPLYKTLLSVGFSEKEALVYLALLELGKRSVSPIARKSAINRTTVYDILDSLVSKGVVSVSGKEPLQEYVAESPDKILDFVKAEIIKKQNELKQAEEIIPQLKSLHNVSDRPQVRFYEGVKGLQEVYEDSLTSNETIRAYANVEDTHSILTGYFPKYYKRRAAKGIKIRAIFPNNDLAWERKSLDKEEARESVIVPSDKYFFSPEINIYDNKVMIASWRERLGIILESKEISEAMKSKTQNKNPPSGGFFIKG
jgi:sugar-specific transcriptional regulator TrmB